MVLPKVQNRVVVKMIICWSIPKLDTAAMITNSGRARCSTRGSQGALIPCTVGRGIVPVRRTAMASTCNRE